MSRWFTADLHLGHENIIRYCHRPFADVEAMNAALIERWNDVVAAGDEVWVLGDLAMGPIRESLTLVAGLSGRKVLVAGNHDRCWNGYRGRPRARPEEWTAAYLDAGFDEIHQGTVELAVGGVGVLAGHFPYQGDSQPVDRYTEFRPHDDGRWILHGHVHDRWRMEGRQINVGVDVWDYRPVAEATIAAIIAGR